MLNINKAIDSLVENGWYHQENVLSREQVLKLSQLCRGRTLTKASIGNGDKKVINESIRSDNISWLTDEEKEREILGYQRFADDFSKKLNEGLYLGLSEFECHFAQYPKGSFYKAHKDSFKNDDRRTITLITYLNENWQEGDGGELRLHLKDNVVDIKPYGGSIICFRSSEILHEVLMSNTKRLSLTGWFLKRNFNN